MNTREVTFLSIKSVKPTKNLSDIEQIAIIVLEQEKTFSPTSDQAKPISKYILNL